MLAYILMSPEPCWADLRIDWAGSEARLLPPSMGSVTLAPDATVVVWRVELYNLPFSPACVDQLVELGGYLVMLINRRVTAWGTGGAFRFLAGRPRHVEGGGTAAMGAMVDLIVDRMPAALPGTVRLTGQDLPLELHWKVRNITVWRWDTDTTPLQVRQAVGRAGRTRGWETVTAAPTAPERSGTEAAPAAAPPSRAEALMVTRTAGTAKILAAEAVARAARELAAAEAGLQAARATQAARPGPVAEPYSRLREARRTTTGGRRRAGAQAAVKILSGALPAGQEQGEMQRRQLEMGWELLLGPAQSAEGRRRANLLLTAWGGREQVCPLGLYWALTRNSLVGASCRGRCCAGVVTGRAAVPCSLKGDWNSMQILPADITGVGTAEALFDGTVELGPWRSLARERDRETRATKQGGGSAL